MGLVLTIAGVLTAFTLLKPYEEVDPKTLQGLSLKERLKRQFLRL